MKILYSAKAISSSGGREGKVRIDNSPLEFEMAKPVELGGSGKSGVNPEQLFAAGYAACFESALLHVARHKNLSLTSTSVAAEVGIGPNGKGGFLLSATITATITGVDQVTADTLVQEAHQVCPYSNATRGNMEVTVSARVV
ncbi:MAG TPA: organic hydroperoxide resistance protein [Firmicutes bacterium]|jgi:lipoyl-dependent peroxiredoxin|nr:organic hydroperoxide resistance protein [Bacillota bacterium]